MILFPYLEKATAFFDASVQQWPACHQYTHTQSGTQWTVGEIKAADHVLSTVSTSTRPPPRAGGADGRWPRPTT